MHPSINIHVMFWTAILFGHFLCAHSVQSTISTRRSVSASRPVLFDGCTASIAEIDNATISQVLLITNFLSQVSQALWRTTQVLGECAMENIDVVTLNELAIEPSAQLKLLHKYAVARLHPAAVCGPPFGISEDDPPWETETEMC